MPAAASPYSAYPQGSPMAPPAWPAPPHMPAPQPEKKRMKTGVLVAIIAGSLVLVLGLAGVVLAMTVFSGDPGVTASGNPSNSGSSNNNIIEQNSQTNSDATTDLDLDSNSNSNSGSSSNSSDDAVLLLPGETAVYKDYSITLVSVENSPGGASRMPWLATFKLENQSNGPVSLYDFIFFNWGGFTLTGNNLQHDISFDLEGVIMGEEGEMLPGSSFNVEVRFEEKPDAVGFQDVAGGPTDGCVWLVK